MNIVEFYRQTPVERHPEVTVSGDRLFFEGDEYVFGGDGELRLVRSLKGIERKLEQVSTKLGISG